MNSLIQAGKRLATAWPRSFLFLSWLALSLIFSIVCDVLIDYFDIILPETNFRKYMESDPVFVTAAVILIAPPFEELIFRLPLRKSRFYGWSIFLLLITAAIFWEMPLFLYSVIIYTILVVLYQNYLPGRKTISPILILFSIALFGAIHLTNYEMADVQQLPLWVVLLLFLPQLFAGVALTVIRLSISFRHAVLFHMAYNALVVGWTLVF